MFNFSNKNVLITGGASGIGKLMGELVLQKGAKLIIWDINQKNIDETRSQFSKFGKVVGYNVDVADIEQVKITAKIVKEEHGAVDVLINNAGISGELPQNASNTNITEIQKVFDTNFFGVISVSQAFLELLKKSENPRISNITSGLGSLTLHSAPTW